MTKRITSKNIIIIITTVILMGLVVFLVGRSYGFFAYKKEGTTPNIISVKGLVANITANSSALTLNEAEPLYDEDGLAQEPFTFTVTNTSSIPSSFTLKIVNDTDRLSACKINEGTQEEAQCPALALSNIRYSYKIGDGEYSAPATLGENNVIDAGELTQNQTKTYYIKIWINSEATNDIMGKYFFGKIIIEGTKKNTITYDFDYTGNVQEFVAPKDGVYKLEVWGAQGGGDTSYTANNYGGYGAYATGTINLEKDDSLNVYVGGVGSNTSGGYNGGGNGYSEGIVNGYGGGGATHITPTNRGVLSNYNSYRNEVYIVAGGGGGAGINTDASLAFHGGNGGGIVGNTGEYNTVSPTYIGNGGTQTSNGALCAECSTGGTFGQGGNFCVSSRQAPGGGSGWYGGNGTSRYHGAGGGGSSYIGNILLSNRKMVCYECQTSAVPTTLTESKTCVNDTATPECSKMGNGYARITYLGNESDNLNMKIMLANANTRNVVVPNSELTYKLSSDSSSEYQNGLFKATDTNGGYTYYYRGNVDNNYLKIGTDIWRIIRINEDSTVRIIKEEGINYNSTTDFQFNNNTGNYTYSYYTNGTDNQTNYDVYAVLNSWYSNTIANNSNYQNIVTTGTYCQAAKVKNTSNTSIGSASSIVKESYTPSYSCPMNDGNITNGKITLNVGLINIDEVLMSGGKLVDTNSTFYLKNGSNFWTMSPSCYYNNYAYVWDVRYSGYVYDNRTTETYAIRPVINLKADIEVTGTGTASDPYVIK